MNSRTPKPPLDERITEWRRLLTEYNDGAVPDISGFAPTGVGADAFNGMHHEYPLDFEEAGLVAESLRATIAGLLEQAQKQLGSHFGPLNTARALRMWMVHDRIRSSFDIAAAARKSAQTQANAALRRAIVESAPQEVYNLDTKTLHRVHWSDERMAFVTKPTNMRWGVDDIYASYAGMLCGTHDDSDHVYFEISLYDEDANRQAVDVWQECELRGGRPGEIPIVNPVIIDGVEGVVFRPRIAPAKQKEPAVPL